MALKPLCVILASCVLLSSMPRTGSGALIPATLGQDAPAVTATVTSADGAGISVPREAALIQLQGAGLTPDEAASRVRSMDGTELAQLQQTDLQQKGGDGLVTVLVVLLIVATVVWLAKNV